MSKIIYVSSRFKKDVKRMKKRGKNFDTFKNLIERLAQDNTLNSIYRDHVLIGNFKGYRECHVEPSWLIIYKTSDDELTLVRTGTHSDLFE